LKLILFTILLNVRFFFKRDDENFYIKLVIYRNVENFQLGEFFFYLTLEFLLEAILVLEQILHF
jgi:hypothetical protein